MHPPQSQSLVCFHKRMGGRVKIVPSCPIEGVRHFFDETKTYAAHMALPFFIYLRFTIWQDDTYLMVHRKFLAWYYF